MHNFWLLMTAHMKIKALLPHALFTGEFQIGADIFCDQRRAIHYETYFLTKSLSNAPFIVHSRTYISYLISLPFFFAHKPTITITVIIQSAKMSDVCGSRYMTSHY